MGPRKAAKRRATPAAVDPPDSVRPAGARPRGSERVWLPALWLATMLVYLPSWHGGVLWDDNAHLTRASLQSAAGLWRIWFDVGATQQYYPAAHSVFWILHRLFGDATLPYHLVTIALHATSACLVALILRRLAVPGALLAAAIFAWHPVQVESVAWMTELKNTLSGACVLGATLAYLRFDERREPRFFAIALGLFAAALLSKTVTAVLPAALLVVFWWQRGALSWQRDVRPLAVFLVLGVGAGLTTAWFERTLNGARGAVYELGAIERLLVAGRALWFYAGTLAWPAHLTFIYPKWTIDAAVWWQYLFPLAWAALLFTLWRLRTRTRAPLAGALLYGGILFPALGFVNIYPFRYSYVADHFQYLAMIPIAALVSAGLVLALERRVRTPWAERTLIVILGVPLVALTWMASRTYANADTLYRATLARNPSCWLCHNNLATARLYGSPAELDEAVGHLRESLRIADNAEAHNNMGGALQRKGQLQEALDEHAAAFRLNPDLVEALYNVAVCEQALGRRDEAIAHYKEAIQRQPDYALAHNNLGTVLQMAGRIDEASSAFAEAVRLEPGSYLTRANHAGALQQRGQTEEAIAQYRVAIGLNPGYPDARYGLGTTLAAAGRMDESIEELRAYVRLVPASAIAHDSLGSVLAATGQVPEAITEYTEAVRLQPSLAPTHYKLANALASLQRTEDAVVEFRSALKYDPSSAIAHNDLGAALASLGRMREAVAEFKEAQRLDPAYADARQNLEKALRLMK